MLGHLGGSLGTWLSICISSGHSLGVLGLRPTSGSLLSRESASSSAPTLPLSEIIITEIYIERKGGEGGRRGRKGERQEGVNTQM